MKKSEEIKNRIMEMSNELDELQKQYGLALKEEKEREAKLLFMATKNAIRTLWAIYWANEDNSEYSKQLDAITDQYRLDMWLDADVKEALVKCKMEPYEVQCISQIIKDLNVKLDDCIGNADIRLDFASALRKVKSGSDLSRELGWCFTHDDIRELAKLHKSNKFRKKIEDLLTDCNFHSECGLMSEGKYDELENMLKKGA